MINQYEKCILLKIWNVTYNSMVLTALNTKITELFIDKINTILNLLLMTYYALFFWHSSVKFQVYTESCCMFAEKSLHRRLLGPNGDNLKQTNTAV